MDTEAPIDHEPRGPMRSLATPKVSIGVPVFNGELFVREALDSLLSQTFTDFELIISDNASSDGTETICQEYVGKDSRFRYVRQGRNLGANRNFQFVLDEAVGEYFIWAAADDLQRPEFLEQLVRTLDQNHKIVCVMSDVENHHFGLGKISISKLDDIRLDNVLRDWPSVRKRFFRNPTSNVFYCIYGLFRIEALRSVEMNYRGNVRFASASEIPLLAQMALAGPIVSIAEPLKTYRFHPNSVYHAEQNRLGRTDRVRGFYNVSHLLLLIALRSPLKLGSRSVLCYTVIRTSAVWPLGCFLRLCLRTITGWLRSSSCSEKR